MIPQLLRTLLIGSAIRNQSGQFLIIAEPIRRVLDNCGIKVALKPFQTLGHIFAKPKDRVPTDQKTHAVYSIPCGDCEEVYLGQTKRQFCTRLKEHQRVVSNFNSLKSALAEHVCETSHNIAWEVLESLPLTIVMVKGFAWKPGISMRALVP